MARRHGRRHAKKRKRSKFDVAPTPVTAPTPVSGPGKSSNSSQSGQSNDGNSHGGKDD